MKDLPWSSLTFLQIAHMPLGEISWLGAVWLVELARTTQQGGDDGEAAKRRFGELHRLAKAQVEATGGRGLTRRGDTILAAFDSADVAVRTALTLRDRFLSSREIRDMGISVRVGVHVGDVVQGSGDTIYGDAVATVSRITPLAAPGQVVLTDIAYRLLKQRSTVAVEDLGEHEIEGVPDPVRLYAATLIGGAEAPDTRQLLQEALTPLQLLNVEGMGGMGEIHLARDANLRRTLAVKVLRSELVSDPQARARFFREAQVIAGLSHPNVIAVHAVGELKDGTPYFVMDYVEGGSLSDRLAREGLLSVSEARRIVGEVASALEAAHARGVVHRDIKTSNVLFDRQSGRALVTDWGIAGLPTSGESSPETRLTQTGVIMGSPEYMSPEQLAGDNVGPETDLYSLGLLAYELLTGHGPFTADTPRGLMVAHLSEAAPALSTLRPEVDPELESVVARCLAKDPSQRPAAEEVARRFAPGAGAMLEWPPPGLEALRGQGPAFMGMALAGVTTLAVPMLVAFAARMEWLGQSLVRELTSGPAGAIVTIMLVAFGPILLGIFLAYSNRHGGLVIDTWKKSRALKRRDPLRAALGLGYGWRTIMEVLDDRWGDLGDLLVGRREYAVIDAAARTRIRRRRLRRSVLRWSSVTVLPLTLVSAIYVVGAGVMEPAPGFVLGLGPSAVLWLVSLLPVEPNAVRLARTTLHGASLHPEVAGPEVSAWKDALRRVVGAGGPDPGRPTSGRTWFAVQAAQVVFFMVPYSYFMALLFSLVAGSVRARTPTYDGTRALLARVEEASALRLPADSTVSREEAHRLMASMTAWDPTVTPWRGPRPGQETVAGSSLTGSALAEPYTLSPRAVVPAAFGGLSRREVAYLEGFGGDPRFPAFERLARAVGYDDGVPEGFSSRMLRSDLPDARALANVQEVALHKLGQAGYQIASGRIDDAETTLREIFSVGALLARETDDLDVALLGRNMAVVGLDALGQLRVSATNRRRGTGSPEAEASWPAGRIGSTSSPGVQRFPDWLTNAMALAADSTTVRSLRLEILASVHGAAECSSLEGILFGTPPELRTVDAIVRRQLIRGPTDEAYVDMAVNVTARRYARLRSASTDELKGFLGVEDVAVYRFLRIGAKIFHNPRLFTCAMQASGR